MKTTENKLREAIDLLELAIAVMGPVNAAEHIQKWLDENDTLNQIEHYVTDK